jgi:hypothetical protein
MSVVRRGDLTDHLLAALKVNGLLVGDGVAPDDGGWDDDPNAPNSSYLPYVVVMPQTAQAGTGSLGDNETDWQIPYTLASYGVTREQVEWFADESRVIFKSCEKDLVLMDGDKWQITQFLVMSIGGIARNDSMEPSEFSQIDLVSLRISKEY